MTDYKPGDVLYYNYMPSFGGQYEGVVRDKTTSSDVVWVWCRPIGAERFIQGGFHLHLIEPHSDPDPVWADYCAALLAGEIADD